MKLKEQDLHLSRKQDACIIEDSLWETIPKVYRRLNQIFVKNMKKGPQKTLILLNLVLGWVETEMETFVTSAVTKEVILLSRWEAAKLYEKALTKIIRSFSMQKCSKEITKATGKSLNLIEFI